MMAGLLYGVGVGPGDPELMTLKAVRLIRENDIIALPGTEPRKTAAYQIAAAVVPELVGKQLLPVYLPMTHDKEEQRKYHQKGAESVEAYLREGKNVVYLTLGDPAVYSTFTYIQQIVEKDGFRIRLVSGVTSFCAAAARVNIPLSTGDESIHIFPAAHNLTENLPDEGTCVFMKSGSRMQQVKETIRKSGRDAVMVENCGMQGEQVYHQLEEIPVKAGYYSLIIARE